MNFLKKTIIVKLKKRYSKIIYMPQKTSSTELSDEFIKKFAELSLKHISVNLFEELVALFNKDLSLHHFSRTSESNLLRILGSMYDLSSFLRDCKKYPHHIELLVAISAYSNYLTDILVRNPEYFYWIINPSVISSEYYEEKTKESTSDIKVFFKTASSRMNALRSLKRKEILRIGVNDIVHKAPPEIITNELSVLAKEITSLVFGFCYEEILNKYRIKSVPRKYCLLALGKLGGDELNYSSDIDLLLFYDKDSKINKKHYIEILNESVLLFIERMTSVTGTGFLYRVDFRLRPDGRNSPLCKPVHQYLNYYETRGEDWERQMLIKSSFICGNKKLYDSFISYLTPFIYPSGFSASPTEQIRRLKQNIETRLGDEENIKLIPGGIRDIEFSVQALQLLNGGRLKSIRTTNTLDAISRLQSENLLSVNEAAALTEAYILYRKIEHFLQLMNDRQTHTIPEDIEMLLKLSSFLGYKNPESFKKDLAEKRKSVLETFNSIMGIESVEVLSAGKMVRFSNKTKALSNLEYLRKGVGLFGTKQFDKESIAAFSEIEHALFEYLLTSLNPDQTLQNFVRIISNANFPSIWYHEFRDKKIFTSFLRLCEFSQKSIDMFASDKDLREAFLSKKVFEKLNPKSLIHFSYKELAFVLSVQFILGMISRERVSLLLSNYVKEIIKNEASNILAELQNDSFFISVMGSTGNNEFTFSSDIDLIFAIDDEHVNAETEKHFQHFLKILREKFSGVEVDCRLRPEGKSSQLVWSIKSYLKYFNTRARIWEIQAFTKSDLVGGNRKMFNKLISSIVKRVRTVSRPFIVSEIQQMRKQLYPKDVSALMQAVNLKKSGGGLTDIEFIIQYILLCNHQLYKKGMGKSVSKSLEIFKDILIPADVCIELSNNYSFLKNLEVTNQLMFNSGNAVLPVSEEKLNSLMNFLGFKSREEFNKKLSSVMKFNLSQYSRIIR